MNVRATALVVIISIIITILVFSFIFKREVILDTNYDNIIFIDSTNTHDTKIGEVIIQNNNFFPAKVNLSNLKACIFNNRSKFTYQVYYTTSNKDYGVNYNHFEIPNFVEVNALTNQKVNIRITLEFPIIRDNLERDLYYKTIPNENTLYLFNETNVTMYHNFPEFCDNVKIFDAIHSIKIINNN